MEVVVTQGVCPHCGAGNEMDAAFCAACGKALPLATPSGPRIVTGDGLASTAVGQQLQGDALRKQAKKASMALLTVAIMQGIFGAIVMMALANNAPPNERTILAVMVFGIAAVFLGLFFWARHQPLPAAIVGLVLFVTLHLLDAIADPANLLRGLIVKLIIIVILVKAIQAGMQHRRLMQEQARGFPVA